MITIDRVRELFTKPKGDENKIIELLTKFLEKIDVKKHGTFIGKKQTVDYEKLMEKTSFPKHMISEERVINLITELYNGVGLWMHPQMQVNVIPAPTTISIVAAALAARYNENSIWDHYGLSASQSVYA